MDVHAMRRGGIVHNGWQDLDWEKLRYMMTRLHLTPWHSDAKDMPPRPSPSPRPPAPSPAARVRPQATASSVIGSYGTSAL
jgi:hypothetical protein